MYKGCYYDRSTALVHIWDENKGHLQIPYKKYGYTYGNGPYKSMFGDSLVRIDKDIMNYHHSELFEADVNPEVRTLIDEYLHHDDPPEHLTIINLDIEIEMESGYPDTQLAENAITSIALTDNVTRDYTVFILDEDNKVQYSNSSGVEIKPFDNEKDLLRSFLDKWEEINPDGVTGWNINTFDVPYLINRIKRVLSLSEAKRLAKIDKLHYDKTYNEWRIPGVGIFDYMLLYKKFISGEKPDYKLDTIAKIELKKGKLEYGGNLNDLFREDIDKFIEYNLTDVKLVQELDDKLKFIDLAISIAHIGHVPYEMIYQNSRMLDGAILTYLKRNGLVAPNKRPVVTYELAVDAGVGDTQIVLDKSLPMSFPLKGTIAIIVNASGDKAKYDYDGYKGNVIYLKGSIDKLRKKGCPVSYFFEGAYVEDPIPGRRKRLYSIDLESLYPSILRTLGISPETKQGRVVGWRDFYFMSDYNNNVTDYVEGNYFAYLKNVPEVTIQTGEKNVTMKTEEFLNIVKSNNLKIAGNGVIYRTDIKGVIPSILTDWFITRKEYKAKMYQAKEVGDYKTAEFYDRYQQVRKVLLNSMYGVLALTSFRFYDLDNAEAVTLTGQDTIKFSQRSVNRKYRESGYKDDNYIIYSDTDSVAGSSVVHSFNHGSIAISDLWDILSSDEAHYKKMYIRDGREFIHPKYIRLPYHDEQKRSIKYGHVEYIERHKVKKRMYRILTGSGKYVDVTEDHSVMVMDFFDQKKRMVEIKPADIKPNYHQAYICNNRKQYSKIIDVEDLGIIDDYVYDVGMKDTPHCFFANDVLVHNSIYIAFPEQNWTLDEMIEFSGMMETHINNELKRYAKYHMNSDDCYLVFKREKITDVGFWLRKKRYAQKVLWNEGFTYIEGKDDLDFKGLDVVRSSFPLEFKDFMEDILKDILYMKSRDEIHTKLINFINNIGNVPYASISRTSAIKKMNEYSDQYDAINDFAKGTPKAVKAAMAYNRLLKYYKCDFKYSPLSNIDKVKYVELNKNKFGFEALAFKNHNDPREIEELLAEFANRDDMYVNELENKIRDFYEALGWDYISPYNAAAEEFFDF